MPSKEKIEVISLGCSKNTVDSERLMNQLKINDFELVENSTEANSVVINTCGFISDAKEESINTILQAIELKKQGKINKVIVAGCLSERYKTDLQNEMPEVDAYIGAEKYDEVLKELGGDLKKNLLGERILTTPKHYSYLKISEGCDNPCSFCAIPIMRGKHRSVPKERLISEATFLAREGVKELIIIGQDTTDYGKDIYGERKLAELLNLLSKIKGIEWIRLLYAYPSHFPEDVINEIANNPKLCAYLDLPLQHISDNVLKSMRRGVSKRKTIELVKNLKKRIPNLTLRTTFIIGYPNETETDFNELVDFVKEVKFDRIGVFNYSVEDDTTAFNLGDTVSEEIKEERKNTLMEVQREISNKKNKSFVGKTMQVIVDSKEGDYFTARTKRDAPEVDGEVLINASENEMIIGKFYNVEIINYNDYDLFGKIN